MALMSGTIASRALTFLPWLVEQPQLGEARHGLLDAGAEDGGEGLEVVATDRQDPAVEVLALDLDDREVAGDHLGLGALGVAEARQVHDDLLGSGGAVDARIDLVDGQQLVDGHVVEAGHALEPGNRDGPLAAFVGAQHRGLELRVGAGLDVLEGEPLLASDLADPFSHLPPVLEVLVLGHGSSPILGGREGPGVPVAVPRRPPGVAADGSHGRGP